MNQTTPELSRRRKPRTLTSPPAILGGGLMCVAAALLTAVVLLRPTVPQQPDHKVALESFKNQFIKEMEEERERSEKREQRLIEQMNALAARPAPTDDAEKKRLEQEKKDLQAELEAERKKQKNLDKSKENMEQAVNQVIAQPPVTGPTGTLQVDGPTAGAGSANGANGNATAAAGEKVGGKGGGAAGLGGAAAVAAAAIAMGFSPVAAILIGLGLGGDLFGTEHKDGGKVVQQVVQMFQDGDQIKLEEAVNRIVAERWEDPTEAIAKIRKALRHPEMQTRLGKDKAKELEKLLAAQEKLLAAHGGMIRDLGREATARLLTDLPPVLLAGANDRAAAEAKFRTLIVPTGGGSVQPETWTSAVGGYILAATNGTALRLVDGEPQPFRVVRNAHIDALLEALKAPPKVTTPAKGTQN